jgi:hypothetical protein
VVYLLTLVLKTATNHTKTRWQQVPSRTKLNEIVKNAEKQKKKEKSKKQKNKEKEL